MNSLTKRSVSAYRLSYTLPDPRLAADGRLLERKVPAPLAGAVASVGRMRGHPQIEED